jgi:hypothetical protein
MGILMGLSSLLVPTPVHTDMCPRFQPGKGGGTQMSDVLRGGQVLFPGSSSGLKFRETQR